MFQNKRHILLVSSATGIKFCTCEETSLFSSVFFPEALLSELVLPEPDDADDEPLCISHSLFLDFLHLSLVRGSRLIEIVKLRNSDHVELR